MRPIPDRSLPVGRVLGLAAACAALTATPLVAAPQEPAPAPAPAPSPPARLIAPGDSGPAVVALQEALIAQGESLTADGEYGRRTEAAVERVRARLGLAPGAGVDAELVARLGIVLPAPPSLRMCPPAASPATGRARHLTTFPVRGPMDFTDDFGDARGQGAHEGNDILAARGQPVVAAADGRIDRLTRSETGLGGIWIWQRATDGTVFYYAHLDAIVPGLDAGDRVLAGQQIATVGNTGDARYGTPHLHFEVHPGGGAAVNPYRDLRAVEADAAKPCLSGEATPAPSPAAAPAATPVPASASTVRVTLSARQLLINQRISQAAVRRVNALRARLGGPPPPPPRGTSGTVRVTVAQMRINQRISQAAVRRVNAIAAQVSGRRRSAERGAGPAAAAPAPITLSAAQLRINQRISQAALRRVNALLADLPPASA